jgi:three-Cys-motif partner protein
MTVTDLTFFEEPSEHSKIKSRIVAKYFWAWAKVIIASVKAHGGDRIAYIDLFAGPGQYKDGTPSTPIMVLQKAIGDPDMAKMLVTVFNDKHPENVNSLRQGIERIPELRRLKYKPQVRNAEVGVDIAKIFQGLKLIPTLLFADPWGYKGLSLTLIRSVLKDWGCDCVFFFNYNRVNMALTNEVVEEHMDALFGQERAGVIRATVPTLNASEREDFVIEELSHALKETGGSYVLPFAFRSDNEERTTHHLIFVSKNFKGYEIMKEIMAAESSERDQGVPSFVYSRASQNYPMLFALSRPLDDLEGMLLQEFAGQKLTMLQIYERHSVGRPYIKSNYKKLLTKMEVEGKIEADPPAARRRKINKETTFADAVIVSFPMRLRDELQIGNRVD